MKDLIKIFSAIREEVDVADSRPALNELYKRAGHVLTLTHDAAWKKLFGDGAEELRRTGDEEFRQTARCINHRAQEIGTAANFDEDWEHLTQSTASGPRVTP